ncbi:3-hydroxyacyl-CoA dehydrogenase family protein [Chitinophaga japonensis]|uniref:3-hydroxybutyryl-CoA dehydrogenase n=1 Tax=Chitinophaga japonensis TaxID=104662 RepID=A0A562SLG2_CHIJA|nr:3-hydroxyacyl-CoA dehydrogenase family protein [Chitinophaga japonensis]TWI82127.1 3-hydroxybutyryl-CoA dehydrogenase [Chitinophaga japonensis]
MGNNYQHYHVGIIGAGIMGQGVAFQCAKFGHQVTLLDISEEVLAQARPKIEQLSRFDTMMQRQQKSPEGTCSRLLDNIRYTTDWADLGDCTFIIENATELETTKLDIFKRISSIIGNDVIVGVNTSCVSITKLAACLENPERVIGLHFSNPVHMMPAVEMVRGLFNSDSVIAAATGFLAGMKMHGIVVNDSPGFISNRVMLAYINEAIYCIHEGVATAGDIDRIFRECLSHTMGPLQTADLIGLDTILQAMNVVYSNFSDSKYRPCILLKRMVDAGILGRKSGKGFYDYSIN